MTSLQCSCGHSIPVEPTQSAVVCPQCGRELRLAGPDDLTVAREPTGPGATPVASFEAGNSSQQFIPSEASSDGIGPYRLLEFLRPWRFGGVYKAYHPVLQRHVLLRTLDPEHAANPQTRVEFLKRAATFAKLNHPNVLGVLEAGEDKGVPYVAEELFNGKPLEGFGPRDFRQRWREGMYPGFKLYSAMLQAANGLEALHETRSTHGRLNPNALLVDNEGRLKIAAFFEWEKGVGSRLPERPEGCFAQTTPEPFFPPQADFDPPTDLRISDPVQHDIFSLGACFYRFGTSRSPFPHEPGVRHFKLQSSPEESLDSPNCFHRRRLKFEVPDPIPAKELNPGICRSFSEILARCLFQAKTAYSGCGELVEDLKKTLQTRATPSRWRPRIYSLFIDGMLVFFCIQILSLVKVITDWIPDAVIGGIISGDFSLHPIVAFFIAYIVLFESVVGWTPGRRLAGLRLADTAGDPASIRWRLLRSAIKLGMFFVPLCIFALVATVLVTLLVLVSPPSRDPYPRVGLSPTLCIVGSYLWPIVGLCAVYVRLPGKASRLAVHDLLTGVQWVESTELDAPAVEQEGVAGALTVPAPSTVIAPIGSQKPDARARDPGVPAPSTAVAPIGKVDQFDVLVELGSGGMGTVYRAWDRSLARSVAVKTLAAHLVSDEVQLERFRREARLAAQISHPHVARVFGAGRWGDRPYIAMEFIDGENLQSFVSRAGAMKTEGAWRYCTEAADALREADRHGIVHRDIKPSNLMVTRQGTLKVTDFGISRSVESDMSVTKTGTILGTPWYMSPEQAMGKEVDRRSDIYSLGMTLYYLLAGHPAFSGNNPMEVLAQQVADEPPSLEGQVAGLTAERWAILRRMLAKKKEDRYADYDSLLEDLRREQPGAARIAGLGTRLTAELMNWIVQMLFFYAGAIIPVIAASSAQTLQRNFFVIWAMTLGVGVLAHYCWGIGRLGKTLGKHWMKLRVTRPDGQRVGYLRAALRFLLAYPSFLAYVPFVITLQLQGSRWLEDAMDVISWCNLGMLAISALIAWRHPQRRMLHDLLTDTVVVRIPEPEKER